MFIDCYPLGFLEEDEWWEVYFEASDWEKHARETFFEAVERQGLAVTYDIQRFEKENWNKEWEDSIAPIRVSDRILITPSWRKAETNECDIILVIDPKMSFGTGFHATTRLMLRSLEQAVRVGDRVLDVGTGTGVLAIAAIKLGASSADGVDTDEWSMENALENATRNTVAEAFHVYSGSIEHVNGPYDLVLSNITKLDNIGMLPDFTSLLAPGGRLILSGFYSDDVPDVLTEMQRHGYTLTQRLEEDGWAALCGERTRT